MTGCEFARLDQTCPVSHSKQVLQMTAHWTEIEPEPLCDYACHIGENPLWHPEEACLYWTDIGTGRLFRLEPESGKHEQVYSGRPVGGFTRQADGSLLLFMDKGTIAVWRDGEIVETVVEEIPQEADSRFNDVIADPLGRVYCGTMSVKDEQRNILRHGRLYRLDLDGTLEVMLEGIQTSNGMGFPQDQTLFYYTDTGARTIWRFHYEPETGQLRNQQPLITVPIEDPDGRPDGLTLDSRGHLWSARWDGSCAVCYTPEGQEEGRLRFPTKKVSSLAFGGRQLDEMYFTTAGGQDKAENGNLAGALFRARLGMRGIPEFVSRIGLT